MKAARSKLSEQLHHWVCCLHLSDGCTIFTVEPTTVTTDHGTRYRQHLWRGYLLAALPETRADPELWDQLERQTLYPTDFRADERPVLEIGPMRPLLTDALG
jgi:hypothetical protein